MWESCGGSKEAACWLLYVLWRLSLCCLGVFHPPGKNNWSCWMVLSSTLWFSHVSPVFLSSNKNIKRFCSSVLLSFALRVFLWILMFQSSLHKKQNKNVANLLVAFFTAQVSRVFHPSATFNFHYQTIKISSLLFQLDREDEKPSVKKLHFDFFLTILLTISV